MEKRYFIRRLTEKGKLKSPNYTNGEPVASWRFFKSEKEALDFIKEYDLNDVIIMTKLVQPEQEIKQRFE